MESIGNEPHYLDRRYYPGHLPAHRAASKNRQPRRCGNHHHRAGSLYPTRFWSYVAISILSLALLAILFYWKRSPQKFYRLTMGGITLVSVVYGAFFIALGKTQGDGTQWKNYPLFPQRRRGLKPSRSGKCPAARISINPWTTKGCTGKSRRSKPSTALCPVPLWNYYPSIGVTRHVGSRPDVKYYGLRGLTSCRWLFDYAGDNNRFADETGSTQMPGLAYYDTQNGYDIWENREYYLQWASAMIIT